MGGLLGGGGGGGGKGYVGPPLKLLGGGGPGPPSSYAYDKERLFEVATYQATKGHLFMLFKRRAKLNMRAD